MTTNFTLTYPKMRNPITVRELLNKLLIPRKWQHLLRINKQVTVNNKYHNFNELVFPNDKITLTINFVKSNQQIYKASGKLPNIIYENQQILIINKPKGQKTHPNLFEKNTALNDCATYLKKSPYIVHRLDMLTSGLLLVAKDPAVVPILNRELSQKIFKRNYIATVIHPEKLKDYGTISFPLGHDPADPRKRMVCPNGLKSITHYQVLKRTSNLAQVKLSLETGRTHQIRVHLAHLETPILGDPLYNPEFNSKDNLQLQAYELELIKPYSFEKIKVKINKTKRI